MGVAQDQAFQQAVRLHHQRERALSEFFVQLARRDRALFAAGTDDRRLFAVDPRIPTDEACARDAPG
jgi:hypothetical protein